MVFDVVCIGFYRDKVVVKHNNLDRAMLLCKHLHLADKKDYGVRVTREGKGVNPVLWATCDK